jgi:hypothetical protein
MARFALRVSAPRPGNPGPVPGSAARAVPVLASPGRPGLAGTLAGLNLSGVDRVIGRLALACLALSGVAALAVAFPASRDCVIARAFLNPRQVRT